MQEWIQVLKAADAAARWHVHQRRKGPAEEPYINHLVEVAMLVADAARFFEQPARKAIRGRYATRPQTGVPSADRMEIARAHFSRTR